MRIALAILLFPLYCQAEQPHAREIQRAVMEQDRRSAEFAGATTYQPLPADAGRPLHADPVIAREWRPYERMKATEGYVLRLPPPVIREKKPLPLPSSLPSGPRHGVEPIAATGVGG
jgi:hypothetical protein